MNYIKEHAMMIHGIRCLLAAFVLAAFTPLTAAGTDAAEKPVRDSLSFFPSIVIVGQVVGVSQFSVTIQNTRFPTTLTPENLERLRARLSNAKDDADSAFYKAIRTVVVTPDSHMQMVFYFDTVTQLFHDDINTYQQFLPLFYLFKSNIKEFQADSKDLVEKFSKMTLDYYLTIPFVKKLMTKSWFAAVFRIHPETKKIVYQHSRFYETYEELEEDEYAKAYLITDVVDRGLTTSLSVALVRGHESRWAKENVHKKYAPGGKNVPGNRKTGINSGSQSGGK
jgi:hypothetical protein